MTVDIASPAPTAHALRLAQGWSLFTEWGSRRPSAVACPMVPNLWRAPPPSLSRASPHTCDIASQHGAKGESGAAVRGGGRYQAVVREMPKRPRPEEEDDMDRTPLERAKRTSSCMPRSWRVVTARRRTAEQASACQGSACFPHRGQTVGSANGSGDKPRRKRMATENCSSVSGLPSGCAKIHMQACLERHDARRMRSATLHSPLARKDSP